MSLLVILPLIVAPAKITLLYHPSVGSSYRFSISSTGTTPAGKTAMSATSTIKILSAAKGLYKVQSKVSNVRNNGASVDAKLQSQTNILTYDKYFQARLDSKNGSSQSQQLMGSFGNDVLGMRFPRKPVGVGDTWNNVVDLGSLFSAMMNGSSADGQANLMFKLVKVTPNSAVIACTVKGTVHIQVAPAQKSKNKVTVPVVLSLSGNGQYTVDRSTGVYLSSTMKVQTVTAANGQHYSSTQSVSMKRT